MKIVFFGTPQIGAEILRKLTKSRHDVIACVTQPDKEKGRGRKVVFSPVKELALEKGILLMQPEKVGDKDFLDMLESLNADLFVVAAYAQKLPVRLLDMPPSGCINVHPSLLPAYRGAAPLTAAILNGDSKTGVTIMEMAEKMDAGDILLQREIPLKGDETTVSLEAAAAIAGGELLLEAIEGIENHTITPVKQDESKVTIIRQIEKNAGLIDFNESALVIERKIRAFEPWPGTFTSLEGKNFRICSAETAYDMPVGSLCGQEAGTVVYADRKKIYIQTGDGLLAPLQVQLEGKKRMTIEEFLRGKPIAEGVKFGS